jgi:uncharacterized protein with PIN domain
MAAMDSTTFHFHDELNDFLPKRIRHSPITHEFDWRASIKDMIESLGVPHAEIDLLIVNETSVDFTYLVTGGDDIHAYPQFDAIEHPQKVRLRPPRPGRARFILDTHLGRLAAYLRMLGFDTLYRNDYPDDELAQVSNVEARILLTRDVGLLKRSLVTYGYFVRNTDPRLRLREVLSRFSLMDSVELFKHCMKCNGLLHPVEKAQVLNEVSAQTAQFYDVFHRCADCQQVYWRGSHFGRMQTFINEVLTTP